MPSRAPRRPKVFRVGRHARRMELVRPQLEAVFASLESARGDHLPKSPVRQAIESVLLRHTSIVRHLDDGALQIDKNACERCMRAPAARRKKRLFAGSADGSQTVARWTKVITQRAAA